MANLSKNSPSNLREGSFQNDYSYLLREVTDTLPGVIIERYQAKHTPGWPGGGFGGRKGSHFDLTVAQTINLARTLVENVPCFNDKTPANPTPNKIDWPIDKELLTNSLYRKIKQHDSIGIYAAFDPSAATWETHFFPNT